MTEEPDIINDVIDARIERILQSLSLKQKIALCSGDDFWHTKGFEEQGVPSFTMSDGPHGLRLQKAEADMFGINDSYPATCFPAAVTAGASWNAKLYAREGAAIGTEALSEGVHVVLGPGCNIKRDPLCGRNFEYLSEDPYFAGHMAASFIQGQQSTGATSSIKHFAANNQEFKRQNGDSQIDDRTLREIYLTPFETAITKGNPGTVMCSYNKINGVHASDNAWLLTDVLRDQWGFDGMVITDWGGLNDRIEAFKAGCDLSMPGGSSFMERQAEEAVKNGLFPLSAVDASARRVIKTALTAESAPKPLSVDYAAHHDLARKIAEQGAVLLKNDDGVLPVAESEMVIIGSMAAEHFRYQGAGSSHINPTRQVNLIDALPNVPYFPCGDKNGAVTQSELEQAVAMASSANVAIVVSGLPEIYESEGFDRDTMRMPEDQIQLIEAVAKANRRTVVVLLSGSAMEMPWIDKVAAVLHMGLSGQAGGQACANLLTGKANPCGKLTETWPLRYEDAPTTDTFGQKNVEYREGLYVGYRYYDKAKVPVCFPFGHGLSYTAFEYSDMDARRNEVWVTVTNTGASFGAEVVQLYIGSPQDGIHRPIKELKGFCRIELKPHEQKRVCIPLDDRAFAIWNDGWVIPSGTYAIMFGASSEDIRIQAPLHIEGQTVEAPTWQVGSWYERPAGKPSRSDWELLTGKPVPVTKEATRGHFTLDNTCLEMSDTCFAAKMMIKIGEIIISRSLKCEIDYSDPAFKVMMSCAADCPLRGLAITSSGGFSEGMANGLLDMANGHYLTGIAKIIKGR